MEFIFKWKKPGQWFWRKTKVIGYRLSSDDGRMNLFFKDGGILEIPDWNIYMCRLGMDWVLATKRQMEKEAGRDIKLNSEIESELSK